MKLFFVTLLASVMFIIGNVSACADPSNDEYGAQVFSINNIVLEVNEADPGNQVEIIIDASNRMPDLKEITGEVSTPYGDTMKIEFYRAYFEDIELMFKSGVKYSLDSAVFDAKDSTHHYYSAILKIPRNSKAGDYQLTSISMSDYDNNRLKYVLNGMEALHSIRSKTLPDGITVSVEDDSILKIMECSTAFKSSNSTSAVSIIVKASPSTKRLSLKFRSLDTDRPYMLRMDESHYNYSSKSFVSTLELPETEAGSTLKLESATLRGDDIVSQRYLSKLESWNTNDFKLNINFQFVV